jgi:hypothetical protein
MKVLYSLLKKHIVLSVLILLLVGSTYVLIFNNQSKSLRLSMRVNNPTVTPTIILAPSYSPTPTIKPIIISATVTPQPIAESVSANNSSSKTILSQTTVQTPIITVNPYVSQQTFPTSDTTQQSMSSDAYLDYLHQWQSDIASRQEKCTEWANQRDASLASLKQEMDSANQRVIDEETNIDNMFGLSEIQKSIRKNDALPKLRDEYFKASEAYFSAFNSYGQCPF